MLFFNNLKTLPKLTTSYYLKSISDLHIERNVSITHGHGTNEFIRSYRINRTREKRKKKKEKKEGERERTNTFSLQPSLTHWKKITTDTLPNLNVWSLSYMIVFLCLQILLSIIQVLSYPRYNSLISAQCKARCLYEYRTYHQQQRSLPSTFIDGKTKRLLVKFPFLSRVHSSC